MFFGKEIGIDLGTANLLIYVKGEGIVVNEPSVVAIDAQTKKCLAAGNEAKEMLGRTPDNVQAIRPLKDGVIADFEVTEIMLNYFLKKINLKSLFQRPTILICCPTNITSVERNAIRDCAFRAGAKKVYIEEEPKVAAVGAGLDISKPNGCMIVDIGGGTTDIAVLSLGDIVTSTSLKIAGDTFDQEIVKYVKEQKQLIIGEGSAEIIKKQVASADANFNEEVEIHGRDMLTGLPQTRMINSQEVLEALHPSLQKIVSACRSVLEQTPPELSGDIVTRGIVVTGGGALIPGLEELLSSQLNVPVYVADNALSCVAEGCGALLENLNLVK